MHATMPTVKPRVNVTLELETYEAIREAAELQHRSMGSILAELADLTAPTFRNISGFMRRANDLDKGQKQALLKSVDESAELFGEFIEIVLSKAETMPKGKERSELFGMVAALGRGEEPEAPDSSNTGARIGN